jgi:hypothetical protein
VKRKAIITYLIFLAHSFLATAFVWTCVAPGRLYYCNDDVPIFTFIPPFAHPNEDASDHYIWPEWRVYLVWLGFVIVMFLFPAIPIWLFTRSYRSSEKAGMLNHMGLPEH